MPKNLVELLNFKKNNRYYTRNSTKLYHKYARTNLKKFCISISGVKFYNDVNQNIRDCDNTELFKKMFKKSVIESY